MAKWIKTPDEGTMGVTDTYAAIPESEVSFDTSSGHSHDGSDSKRSSFLKLADSPASYTGEGGNNVRVNVAEDALEFVAPGAPGAHKDTHDPEDGADPLDSANAAEISVVVGAGTGASHSFARADHVHAINHAITDNHLVTLDGSPNANEIPQWTANGLKGLNYAALLAALSGQAGAAFSMNSQQITNLASAVNPTDAVNLDDVMGHIGVTLNYWLSNAILTQILTVSETSLTETPSSTPETLSTITFKSTVAETPAPFAINAGTIIALHFDADETGGAGRSLGLHAVFGYVDADGTSNFVQIGADSDSTGEIETAKTAYELHIHVAADTVVPAGKRLWLKFVSTSLSGGGAYPELNVYYDAQTHHLILPVAGSVLGNYIPKALLDAQSIISATSDNTPIVLAIAEQRVVGRITGGDVAALTAANLWAMLLAAAPPENSAFILDPALSADGKYSGPCVEAGTAGSALAFGEVCYLASSGKWLKAKADVAATSKGKLGMCILAAGADTNPTTMLLYGKIRADAAFPALTVGAPAHVDAATAGDIVVAAPSGTTNFVVRIIGYGNTADELFFCPDNTYLELA